MMDAFRDPELSAGLEDHIIPALLFLIPESLRDILADLVPEAITEDILKSLLGVLRRARSAGYIDGTDLEGLISNTVLNFYFACACTYTDRYHVVLDSIRRISFCQSYLSGAAAACQM